MASDLASIVQELLACGIHDPARKHPDDSPAKGCWSVITAPTELVERLRSALAILTSLAQASQARPDGGAVAWMDDEGRVLSREQMHNAMNHQGGPGRIVAAKYSTPLFPPGNATQAAGAREPLTNLQIADCATDLDPYPMELVCVPAEQLVAFVRNIEAAHGIASPAAELKKE